MSSVDIFLLLVLLVSVLVGVWRGLVHEVLSVAAWVVAYLLAQWLAPQAAQWLPLSDTAEPLRYAAGFVVVFVLTLLVVGLVSWLIKQGLEQVGLRPVDRVLGAVFGAVRGVVVLLALALLVNMTPLKGHAAWRGAAGSVWLDAGLRTLKVAVPEKFASYFP